MTNTKEKQVLPIAELLPEGLSEAAVTEIATLVNTVIAEQVGEKVRQLEAKVKGFFRLRVDELKDQAKRELMEEDDVVRNAALFESVKSLMAVEMNKDDEEHALSSLMKEQEEFEEEVNILTEELRKSFGETDKLETLVTTLSHKINKLEEDRDLLIDTVESLEESKEEPFKSSEKAIVITENVDDPVDNPREIVDNDFLTPEVMKFMPSNTDSK